MGDVGAPPGPTRAAGLALWPLRIVRKLIALLPTAVDGYFAHRLPQHAAAIAYRVLFSLVPLAIVLVSVFGLVLQNDGVRQDVIDSIVDWLPVSEQGGKDVEQAITKIASPASALWLLSLVLFAWASTGMMAAIRNGLETAMDVQRSRPAARAKLVDFVLVAAAGALVLVAVGLSLASQVLRDLTAWLGLDGGLTDAGSRIGFSVAVSTIAVILLYRFVPAAGLSLRDAVAGSFVTALLFLAISAASAFIYEKTTRLSVIYGSITVALVFLYSVYLYASALLLGAGVAAEWSRPPQGPGGPLLQQVRRAIVGLFVHREQPPDQPGSGTSGGRTT